MVTKAPKELRHFKLQVGLIRISTDELVEELSNEAFDNIDWKAECNEYQFTDLEDMKINRLHLAGRPHIIGALKGKPPSFQISFHRGVEIQALNLESEGILHQLELLGKHFEKYRTLFYHLGRNVAISINWIPVLIIIITALIIGVVNLLIKYVGPIETHYSYTLILIVFICSYLTSRASVYNASKSNVFSRISDKFLLYILTFITGVVLTFTATKYGLIKP